jgi:hypothetical protein
MVIGGIRLADEFGLIFIFDGLLTSMQLNRLYRSLSGISRKSFILIKVKESNIGYC